MGPARFHCATLLAADRLSTYTPSEARSNCFGKTLPELLFCVLPGLCTIKVVVAEWLRRWTRNPLGSPRAGSNPADYVEGIIFIFSITYFYDDDDCRN